MKRTPIKRKGRRAKSWRFKLRSEFSKLIRARDKDCVFKGIAPTECGGNLQCSHILPKGQYPLLALHPKNAVAHCFKHHIFYWHKNPWEAKELMMGYLGGEWSSELEWLRFNSHDYKKYDEAEWRQIWKDHGLC